VEYHGAGGATPPYRETTNSNQADRAQKGATKGNGKNHRKKTLTQVEAPHGNGSIAETALTEQKGEREMDKKRTVIDKR